MSSGIILPLFDLNALSKTSSTRLQYLQIVLDMYRLESLPKPENPDSIFIADKWDVDDFEIEKLNKYPFAYCKKVIMYMDECFRLHEKHTWEWQRTQDKLVNEKRALEKENAILKEENAGLKGAAREAANLIERYVEKDERLRNLVEKMKLSLPSEEEVV